MEVNPNLTAAEIFDDETENLQSPAQSRKGGLTQRHASVDIGDYARFPNKLFGSGLARKLGPSATLLYLVLCEAANRNSKGLNTCSVRDDQLAWETGLGTRTIRDKRTKLVESGLVQIHREPGQKYIYTLLPQDLKWLKVKDRAPRQKKQPRGMHAQRVKDEESTPANFAGGAA